MVFNAHHVHQLTVLLTKIAVFFIDKIYGALLGSKLMMQTFFKDDFRIATLVAWLIANVVSFDIFCENLRLSARSMAYKCFSLSLLSNCNSCYMVNCQLSFSSHFLRKLTSFCTVLGLRHKHYAGYFPNIRMTLHARLFPKYQNSYHKHSLQSSVSNTPTWDSRKQ